MEDMKKVSSFHERLNLIINQTNRRPADVAREANFSRTTIGRYLSGKYSPSPRAIVRIAQALGVSELWLDGFDVPQNYIPEEGKNSPDDETLKLSEEAQMQAQEALALISQVLLDSDLLRIADIYLKLPKEDQFIAKTFLIRLAHKKEKAP